MVVELKYFLPAGLVKMRLDGVTIMPEDLDGTLRGRSHVRQEHVQREHLHSEGAEILSF